MEEFFPDKKWIAILRKLKTLDIFEEFGTRKSKKQANKNSGSENELQNQSEVEDIEEKHAKNKKDAKRFKKEYKKKRKALKRSSKEQVSGQDAQDVDSVVGVLDQEESVTDNIEQGTRKTGTKKRKSTGVNDAAESLESDAVLPVEANIEQVRLQKIANLLLKTQKDAQSSEVLIPPSQLNETSFGKKLKKLVRLSQPAENTYATQASAPIFGFSDDELELI